MESPPLHWRRALLYTLLVVVAGAGALLLLPSSRQQIILSLCLLFVATGISAYWILTSQRAIQLKRERRVWFLLVIGMLVSLLGHLYHLSTLPEKHALSPSPADLIILVSFGVICAALLMRSGKYPHDTLAKGLLLCDLLIIIWASGTLAGHLAVPAIKDIPNATVIQHVVGFSYPVSGILTLVAVALMLFRAVARPWQGPRGLLVAGVLLVLVGDITARFMTEASGVALMVLLVIAGVLCYGVSAIWEASLYAERSIRQQVIDPFPSVFGMLIPALLIVASLSFTLDDILRYRSGSDNSSMLAVFVNLAVLVMLVTARHVLTFVNHRHLYRGLQQLYAEMTQHAATDPLTNLANHRYFMERLQKEVRRAVRYRRPLALIFCDLDHFKRINDTYGHVSGDRVLCAMAASLQNGVRELDTIARYGGEEFVVLLPETTLRHAEFLAERLRASIEELVIPYRQDTDIRVTMSCGVSAYPETSDTLDLLLSTADHAMYVAKSNGRNRVVSAPAYLGTTEQGRA